MYPQEWKQDIDKHMMWFQSLMQVSTNRLIRMIVGPIAFGEKPVSEHEMEKDSKEFYDKILPRLDKLL